MRNLDACYAAFDVKPGEKLYLALPTASEFGEIPRLFQNSTGGCQVAERDYRNRSSETGCFRSAQCAKTHSRNKSCKSLILGLDSVWVIC